MFASGILALTLTGCDGAPASATVASSPAPPTADGSEPAAAGPSAPSAGPSAPKRQEQVAVGDDSRVVDLFVPALAAGVKAPLLLLLHASGESPFVMEQTARAGELAAREGVVVALPPARERRWDALVSSGDPITPSGDAAYLLGLIDRLGEELPIDQDRVFVAGFSIGAVMSERMACEFADRVTAVALNAGAPWSDTCAPSRPLSILVLHGSQDTTFRIGLAVSVVERWRVADGCLGAPAVIRLSDIATAEVNEHCDKGVTVQFVRYEGLSHRWLTLPDATDLMWQFFAAQEPR